jgi:hypothetical protein
MPGFHFKETMQGTFTRAGSSDEKAMSFTVTARAQSWLKHLRDRKAMLDGVVRMDGFASDATLAGELTIDPVLGKIIRYDFRFTADDGRPYRFLGQKDVTLRDLAGSMTTLPGTISDAGGAPVATALLYFDKSDLPKFLGSFRPF